MNKHTQYITNQIHEFLTVKPHKSLQRVGAQVGANP